MNYRPQSTIWTRKSFWTISWLMFQLACEAFVAKKLEEMQRVQEDVMATLVIVAVSAPEGIGFGPDLDQHSSDMIGIPIDLSLVHYMGHFSTTPDGCIPGRGAVQKVSTIRHESTSFHVLSCFPCPIKATSAPWVPQWWPCGCCVCVRVWFVMSKQPRSRHRWSHGC